MRPDASPSDPIELETLLPAAVREILRHEDPQRFQAWLREHLSSFATPAARAMGDAVTWRALATAVGIGIWNATPLPGNRFRPRPLARAGRNDPCPCGSGRKFKRCCGELPSMPPVAPELMWSYVLDALPVERRKRLLDEGGVPLGALAAYAQECIEVDDAAQAAALLEPLFAGPLGALTGEEHEFAFDTLLNAYDELGHTQEKNALIDRAIDEAARSPLRAAAWQRLATIRMDAGDAVAAWDAFENARRDRPDAPGLAYLEVVLLAASGRMDEIAERARAWLRRLRGQGLDDDDPTVEWLRDVAEDPDGVLDELGLTGGAVAGGALLKWLETVAARPLPAYRLVDDAPATEDDEGDEDDGDDEDDEDDAALAARLRAMGVPAGQLAAAVAELKAGATDGEDETPIEEDEAPMDEEEPGEDTTTLLTGPPALRALERQWRRVFPLDKPFSVNDHPISEDDPWETEDEWCEFLVACPEAFDSLDILDDLATAAMLHPAWGDAGFDEEVALPVLERAQAIVERALGAHEPTPRLAWALAKNRPALRALVRLAKWKLAAGNVASGLALAERVFALNPRDIHGLRTILMDEYLYVGRDEDAVALAARFPHDLFAETRYGHALALYRLQRIEDAHEALAGAVSVLPKVRRYLLAPRIRKPQLELDTITAGGDDQAWYYRDHMRGLWRATPGALDWLRRTVPAPPAR